MNRLVIVIPCYNEEKVLPKTAPMFEEELTLLMKKNKIAEDSYILFVNDGSKDTTWQIIKDLSISNSHFRGISLSRNRGHANALLAGLMEVKDTADITISIDCDGQDDITAMDKMLDEYLNGNDVVYGVRNSREKDTFFKRFTAQSFYKFMTFMGADTVYNHADYRLLSKRVLQELSNFKEVNLYLRGLVPLIGYKASKVYYDRAERIAGESHYPLSKMAKLALDGITGLSDKPMHIICLLGFANLGISFPLLVWLIIALILQTSYVSTLILTFLILFCCGLQLVAIGVVGEYVARTYLETKERPRFIISERTEK